MGYIKQHKKHVLRVTVLFVFLVGSVWAEPDCVKGLATDGYTLPAGDITLEYGQDLNITCILKKSVAEKFGPNASSRLKFLNDSKPVPEEFVKIISSRSIQLYVPHPEKTERICYSCAFDDGGKTDQTLCINAVRVGVPPQEVTDFKCLGDNYEKLNCSWKGPRNYVSTNYSLWYTLDQRTARFRHYCPKIVKTELENSTIQYNCSWSVQSSPYYRQSHQNYTFHLERDNMFGKGIQLYKFDNYKEVRPAAPTMLTGVATSPHSVKLNWSIPSTMVPFPPGVHHRIMYTSKFEKDWYLAGIIKNAKNRPSVEFNVTGLRFAHCFYDFRVSIRSSLSLDESMWSDNATIIIDTLSKIPDRPPRTTFGSFEVINDSNMEKEVFIYWQQIGEEEMNGDEFSYHVELDHNATITSTELTKTYAKFNLFNADRSYIFYVWSKNNKGFSQDKSMVYIPDSKNSVKEPSNFIKVVNSKYSETEDLYELGWQPPKYARITNYTIFWCDNDHDRPYQCNGNISWVVVPNNLTSYKMTLPKFNRRVYQFAISTNTLRGSSGMLWAKCTIISSKRAGKLDEVYATEIGSTFIVVTWKLDCRDNIDIVGYVIEYCVISNVTEGACQGKPIQKFQNYSDSTSYNLTDLRPYTIYGIQVGVKFKHYTSQMSDMIRKTTNEDAPTVPRNLQVTNVTNSSISLRWEPPLVTNGVLKYYKVYYSDRMPPIEVDKPLLEANIKDLEPYTEYNISIEACTTHCSRNPSILKVKTKMWKPAKVLVHEIFRNSSYVTVVWDKPNPSRGKVDYYEVNFIRENNSENNTGEVILRKENNFVVKDCGESGKYNTFYVSVRAINTENGTKLVGPWSEPLHSYCKSNVTPWVYIVIAVSIVCVLIVLFYFFKKVYSDISNMKKLVPTLPEGLASVVNEYEIPKTPTDETTQTQLLLQRVPSIKSYNSNGDGDSSGCSSGHDSRTSSLQSGSHLSTSDSGTEQPRTPSLGEADLGLRQRSVTPRPMVNKAGYIKQDAIPQAVSAKPKSTPPGSYCIFGIDPKVESENESPYIPLTVVPATSEDPLETTPHIVPRTISSPTNAGNIAHTAPEPVVKTTGYIVAGIPTQNILVPEILQPVNPINENTGYVVAAPPSINENTGYVVAAPPSDTFTNIPFQWQPQPVNTLPTPKSGYVCVGDALPSKTELEMTIANPHKGYVPHKQFDAKTLKTD